MITNAAFANYLNSKTAQHIGNRRKIWSIFHIFYDFHISKISDRLAYLHVYYVYHYHYYFLLLNLFIHSIN